MQTQLVVPTELLQVIIDPIEVNCKAAIMPINFEVNQCYLEKKLAQITYRNSGGNDKPNKTIL